MLASRDAYLRFLVNPYKYLSLWCPVPPKPTRSKIVILGPPVSGKSTQSKLISEELNIPLLDVEKELQRHISEGNEIGKFCKEAIASGGIVPVEAYIYVLTEFSNKIYALKDVPYYAQSGGWVIDGFPRTAAEVIILQYD